MLKNIIMMVVLLFGSSCVYREYSQPTHYISNPGAADHLINSTVALVASRLDPVEYAPAINTRGKPHRAYCAGVFISNTVVLTARHCIQRRQLVTDPLFGFQQAVPLDDSPLGDDVKVSNLSFSNRDNYFNNYSLFSVVKVDAALDLALLSLKDGERNLALREVASISPRRRILIGEEVYNVGHPAGDIYTITQGIVSKSYSVPPDEDENFYIQTTAPIFFGNSGGGLFDHQGRVIGICSRFYGNDFQSHLGQNVHLYNILQFVFGGTNA